LNVWGLTSGSSQASFHFVGGGTRLSENGANQINLLQAPTNMLMNNNVLATSVVVNPDGSVDLATLAGGPNGLAVVPLPPEAYVTSFEASNPTSNVKIMSGSVTLDKSRTVNALLLGPGVTINRADSTGTLTVTNGPLVFGGSGTIDVPYLTLGANAGYYIMANGTGNTATISSIITGGSTGQWLMKGGAGTLVLSGANQFQSLVAIGQGIVNLRDSSALGTPGQETRVYIGAQLQLQGDLTILGETLNAYSTGLSGAPASQQGALYAVSRNSLWNGPVNLYEGPWANAADYFPNGSGTLAQSNGIGVADGASLNISGVLGGNTNTWYKFGGGTLELSGTQANTLGATTRRERCISTRRRASPRSTRPRTTSATTSPARLRCVSVPITRSPATRRSGSARTGPST
jgi:hypothetical protein